jgi:hypothetical protein
MYFSIVNKQSARVKKPEEVNMKKDGFFAELVRQIVEQYKKNARKGKVDPYFNQKKQLWYGMMSVVDADADAAKDDGKKSE